MKEWSSRAGEKGFAGWSNSSLMERIPSDDAMRRFQPAGRRCPQTFAEGISELRRPTATCRIGGMVMLRPTAPVLFTANAPGRSADPGRPSWPEREEQAADRLLTGCLAENNASESI
jgi:hypothetical protein